jgi:hypothetical protein
MNITKFSRNLLCDVWLNRESAYPTVKSILMLWRLPPVFPLLFTHHGHSRAVKPAAFLRHSSIIQRLSFFLPTWLNDKEAKGGLVSYKESNHPTVEFFSADVAQ